MIKIYKYGEVSNSEIFARDNIASGVEGIVADIIANVIKSKDKALFELRGVKGRNRRGICFCR